MTFTIQRPELAKRALTLTDQALELDWVRAREAFVREKVLARAQPELTPESLERDPAGSVRRALRHHETLLSVYEFTRARAWTKSVDPDTVLEAVHDFVWGDDDLLERATRFLEAARPREVADNKIAHVNETVASYLLGIARPDDYAFAKPASALQPAWRLLVSDDGDVPTGPERLTLSTALYSALRTLWSKHSGFDGDLLDVHTRLFILGAGRTAYVPYSWASALAPEDVAEMVHDASRHHPEWPGAIAHASQLMRQTSFDASLPEDPYRQMMLEEYAYHYGSEERTLAWVLEHGTPEVSELTLDDVATFGLAAAPDGSWMAGTHQDVPRAEAEAIFETSIKPRLGELATIARAMVSERPATLRVFGDAPYRAIDGKLLTLTAAAYDPEWTWTHLAPVANLGELTTLARVLGVEDMEVERTQTFPAYLDALLTLDAQLDATLPDARPPLGALTRWMREHPLGKLVARIAHPPVVPQPPTPPAAPEPQDRSLEEHSEDLTAPPLTSVDTWRALFGQLSEPELESLARLLRARKNVVLYGPPGTGKTVVSTKLAMHWRRWQRDGDGASSVEQVTFHPSYGYEEFVEGFRPRPGAPGEFSLQDGVLKRLAARAKAEPHRQFLLLIDEVNRGDVARIFGELITLIESDKRSAPHARRTMFSQEPLWLTPNVHVLGTMNTADKSISLIDVAIRRRFAFVLMGPEPRLLGSAPGIVHEVGGVSLAALLSALNRRLGAIGVPPERHLGHAFFWLERDRIDDPVRALAERFRLDVVPLIEEYCFSDRRQMRHVLGNLVDRHGRPVPALFDPEPFVRELRALIEERDDPPRR